VLPRKLEFILFSGKTRMPIGWLKRLSVKRFRVCQKRAVKSELKKVCAKIWKCEIFLITFALSEQSGDMKK
jgi:hypothetical protein